MYTNYFGLKEKPFTISPDPRYLYMSEHHREALAHLLYGINSDGCLILLTGDVGTGKTTVCRSLLEQLPENTETAMIVNPKLNAQELLETICEELKISYRKNRASTKVYIDSINKHLLDAHAKGNSIVLIIDEAQNLDMDVLEQLRLLTNLETDTHKLLKIVLIGQPELQKKLENPRVSQIDQRITSRYHLAPLSERDVFGFIQHRLIVAGGGRMQFFSEEALHQAYILSRGIPRLINILCDRALLGAYVEEKNQVSEQIVIKAAKEVFGKTIRPMELQKHVALPEKIMLLAFSILLLAATAFYFLASPTNPVKQFFNSTIGISQQKSNDTDGNDSAAQNSEPNDQQNMTGENQPITSETK